MIKIGALTFLLLIELCIILAGLAVFLGLRVKKTREISEAAARDFEVVHMEKQDLEKQLAEARAEAADTQPASTTGSGGKGMEELNAKIETLEAEVEEKEKKMTSLKQQFADLEKEYMVLYQQQKAAQEQNKSNLT